MRLSSYTPAATAGALSLFAFVGCQPPADLSGVEEKLAALDKKQDKILSRLDDVEKAAKSKAAAPARPQRQRPDSKTVHSVPLGEAVWKGAKDAKVTIVEWSDFQ